MNKCKFSVTNVNENCRKMHQHVEKMTAKQVFLSCSHYLYLLLCACFMSQN